MTDAILIEQPGKKKALHQSILAGLSKCAKQVEWRYIHGLKVPPGSALVIGQACHTAADKALVAKAKGEEALPAEALKEAAAEALSAQWDGEGVVLDEDEEALGSKAAKGQAVDTAVGLVGVYHKSILPVRMPASPLHVERRLRGVLDGFPFDIEGTVDLQEADGSLRDLKTAKRAPGAGDAIGNVQLDTYSMLAFLADGVMPARVGLDTLVKTVTPKHVIVEAPPTASFDHVTARIEHAARVFESGAFMPVDPHGPSAWVCTRAHCGYWQDICQFGRKARVTVAMGGAS